ncbi:hypothetical protein [Thermoleophilum album]|uniref:Uncharacterized protein n=1 Tax=Thermoleophilum album TaxID=29539 RepID=A0A1H6FKQ2_THEAL|nr:hypothetical protein [Thermoleophilum album]SEH10423.1 hypothetical protein SAMN02745716_0274 [Thermoleophilum album]
MRLSFSKEVRASALAPLVRVLYAPLVRSALARLAALAEEEQRSGA